MYIYQNVTQTYVKTYTKHHTKISLPHLENNEGYITDEAHHWVIVWTLIHLQAY